ncbi:MAG: outer membrane beta-barrel protein [Alistipes sp.]|nr:outer membrane beta-barrel protein [Alistipes sp.]
MKPKRIILFLLAIVSLIAPLSAQHSATVSGRLLDFDTNDGVIAAVIEMAPKANPDKKRYTTSEYGGYFKFSGVPEGEYKCVATFIGYENYTFEFKCTGMPKALGNLIMRLKAIGIDAVVKEGVSTRAVMLGDTLRFNADAFKVAVDAEVETLLRKMPGITISDGKIEAQGEEVKQIYVDGVEFFGSNIQQVLQSIPAQAVEHIEIYNRLSEAAQITGVDDGEGGKVINIITRQSMKHSAFGKVHIGYGYEPTASPEITAKHKYTAGGSVNIFKDDTRVTVMALANNLNKQNLTDDDVAVSNHQNNSNASRQFSVNSQQGVASAEIFALNYTDRWGARRRAKFEGSVFYNHINAKNDFYIDRWYDESVAKKDTIHYDQFANPNNHSLKFRGRLDWRVAKRQKLVLIPTLNYYNNSSINRVDTTSLRWGESGYRWMPSGNDGWSHTLSGGVYAQYSYKFLKQGRTLMVVASVNSNHNDGDRDYYSNNGKTSKKSPEEATIKYSYTRKLTDSRTTTIRVQPTFRERLGRHTTLNLTYRWQAQFRSRDLLSYATDADYVIDTARLNRRSSSSFDGTFIYHQAGVGFRYGKQRNWFSINLMYQNSRLSTRNLWSDEGARLRTYHSPIYNATLQWSFDDRNTLRVSANSEVKSPSLWSLIDVYDVSNSQYLSRGNPDLRPFTEHNFFARYTNTSVVHGTTFMVMAKAQHIQNYIGTDIIYSPETITVDGKKYNPIQVTRPINLNGYWSYEGRASIGFPIKWLGSNLNISLGATYSTVPIRLNEANDMMNNLTAYSQWTLGSNISEKVDFTIDWRGSYSTNRSSLDVLNNDYFTHRASANVKVVLPLGFTLTTSAIFTQFLGITNGYNDSFTLWNASIGKKVLRNLGEIELCVNDILGQNTSFSRHVWAGYSQVRYNTTPGRTFLVRFTYNLRSFASPTRRMKIQRASGIAINRFDEIERKLAALKF